MRYTLLTFLLHSCLSAAQAVPSPNPQADPDLWPTLIVLGISFVLGIISFMAVDHLLRDVEKERTPGEDAYIDQMLVANGAHLNLDRQRPQTDCRG